RMSDRLRWLTTEAQRARRKNTEPRRKRERQRTEAACLFLSCLFCVLLRALCASVVSPSLLLLALGAFLRVLLLGDLALARVLEGRRALGVQRGETGPLGGDVGLG